MAYFYGNDYFYLNVPRPLWFILKAHEKSIHIEMQILNTQHCNNQSYKSLIFFSTYLENVMANHSSTITIHNEFPEKNKFKQA